jgi:hypothetical protein
MKNAIIWDMGQSSSLQTYVSEERIPSIIRMKLISDLETTLAISGN